MSKEETLDNRINKILIEWDPVGIKNYPDDIKTEYIRYIPEIRSNIQDYQKLKKLLWRIGSIDIGTHKPGNIEHEEIVAKIASKLYDLMIKSK